MNRWRRAKADASAVAVVCLITGVCWLLLMEAVRPINSQDWAPFHIAAHFAHDGRWRELYPSPSATSLLDVPASYQSFADEHLARNAGPLFPKGTLTAFVSPPPAAFLLRLMRDRPWWHSQFAWRVVGAIAIIGGILLMAAEQIRVGRRAPLDWAVTVGISMPLLLYTSLMGQPTVWLILLAAVTCLPPSRRLDCVGAAALALGVITKATPILLLAGFWIVGRRRLAVWGLGLVLIAGVATLAVAGIDPWRDFLEVSGRLGGSVITEWNNVSVEATVGRLTLGASDSQIRRLNPPWLLSSWALRITLVLMAAVTAFGAGPPARRMAAVWVGWLACTPLLWFHYLAVLLPLFCTTTVTRRWPGWAFAAVWSGCFVARVTGVAYAWAGTLGSLSWLTAAFWLLSHRAWDEHSRPNESPETS